MYTPTFIDSQWLLDRGASPECDDLRRFRAEWPDGVWLTADSLKRAGAIGLNIDWLALKLDPNVYEEFRAATAADRDTYRVAGAAALTRVLGLDAPTP